MTTLEEKAKSSILKYGQRNIEVKDAVFNIEENTIRYIVSTETPYLRYHEDIGEYYEILSHNEEDIDFSKAHKSPLLFEHDPRNQIGVNEQFDLIDKKLFVTSRFSKNSFPQEVYNDYKDGIKNKFSVGYINLEYIEVEPINGIRTFVVKWKYIESSSVSIPADEGAIIISKNENIDTKELISNVVIDEKQDEIEKNEINENVEQEQVESIENIDALAKNENITNNNSIVVENNENNFKKENKNMSNIAANLFKKAEIYGIDQGIVVDFVKSGMSEDQFDGFVQERNASKTAATKSAPSVDLSKKEEAEFNLYRGLMTEKKGVNSFEVELSNEIKRKSGDNSEGLVLPMTFWRKAAAGLYQSRAYNTATGNASGASNLVAEVLEANEFIELLRPMTRFNELGIRTLSGNVGDLAFPRQTGGMSSTWVSDSGASTESSATFDKVVSKPKMLVSETEIFELANYQMTPAAQMLALQDMMEERARALELAVYFGSGLNGQPRGILNTTGVQLLDLGADGAALTRDNLIDLETMLGANNVNTDNTRFVTNDKVKGALRKLKIDAGSGLFVYDEFKDKMSITNLMPSNLTQGTGTGLSSLILGDFSGTLVTSWFGPNLVIDGITGANVGKTKIFMRQGCDVVVRNPKKFVGAKAIIA